MSSRPGRIAALDFGRRRIGVAVSDAGRVVASPHSTFELRSPAGEPPGALLELLRQLAPTEVLIGIPLNMDGSEGAMVSEARKFGTRIGEILGLPVTERDERLSSVEADRRLREAGVSRSKRREKGRRDMIAAAVLLEDFLAER